MSELPQIITDLAYILIIAGLVTLIFKRLGQPLVLGYIVAGFLAGPHMTYTPTVVDSASIQSWADIGVIFLMFTLGLEFSFKKIIKMGTKPIIAACLIMFCMISVGSVVGHLFGWSSMNSLFLGGMLAMSSTTIIYKALDDLGLRQQKFAGEVLSVLILEDILGILLMVILSAMAVSRHFEGWALAESLLKLTFFLILWFIVGVFIVPTFLRKSGRWMNKETLVVVSTGLCFALVVAAAHAGYSSAFGAFMMGSILAETIEAENIERVISSLKDLFGAIFFVSVGMLVNPFILSQYWLPILVITIVVIVCQAVLGSASFVLAGQSLRVAMQCGFSMAQIGEFAFIIASLGITLGVTGEFLYPVVVAVSIITTFTTPYMMRAATPACNFVERILPKPLLRRLDDNRSKAPTSSALPWKSLLGALMFQVAIYTTLSIAAVFLSFGFLLPFSRATFGHWAGNAVCGCLTFIVVAPFLRAIVMRKNHSEEWKELCRKGRLNRAGLWMTFITRYAIATAIIWYVTNFLSPWPPHAPLRTLVFLAFSVAIVGIMIASRSVKYASIRMERTFLRNLRSREISQTGNKVSPYYAGRLLSHNMHIARMKLPADSSWAGHTLGSLDVGRTNGVIIAAVIRGPHRINIPDGDTMLFPEDTIEVLGDDISLQRLTRRLQTELTPLMPNDRDHHLIMRKLVIADEAELCHHTLQDSGLKQRYRCLAIGFEGEDGTIDTAASSQVIEPGYLLWIIGEEKDVKTFLKSNAKQE